MGGVGGREGEGRGDRTGLGCLIEGEVRYEG